ncbi:MAG: beta-galactosidase [Melioribacteraceae bacterium]|nr:beta-galactosidase [Melioribacteraceae bacterium]MCF8353522.1 beta-galactosidase [Melioribacteraceae bacterium]MCF8392544.1 beta-galactosidase [Melioribacteraceae bacterium]MCF8418441.1 beta-galactosidase [Melioribacteraceae bacterium]
MRNLLKENYFPFGSQYYRAPSPHREDWDSDLKNMCELGFNMVKYWVQWRWNNPGEDEYYFDDIDELMDLAQKYNLKVMLNTIFDVAPAWIYQKYPDASMITLGGKQIGPQSQPHRQIGGLGYCFNHDGVIEHFYEFLSAVIERYKEHPSLEIWNVGSEPELTSSMAEMRAYADNAEKIDDMLCYCDNCKRKFRGWLSEKYQSIDELNESWNRNYKSFEEAELPKTRNTFNDIIDWRMFFVHTLGENVKKRFEVAKGIDEGRHPLMCHHVFIQGFPITSTANDPWNVGQYGDLHGFTQMDDAAMIDILRSCAKDKPVISAEMLMLPGYTLDLPNSIDENDIKRFIFSGVAGNQKGFIFWQYRPEILGREAPTWGLTTLDGKQTGWLKSFAEIGQVLQKNKDLLFDGKPEKAEVAILYNPENMIFAWASTGNEKNATDSLLGYHRALHEYNYNVDFIHPVEFDKDILSNYKVLVVPFPYVINKAIASAIKGFVENGGLLIGESYFAGWNVEHGHHEKVVPGYGMNQVFKVYQGVVDPADKTDGVNIKLMESLSKVNKGDIIKGRLSLERLVLNGAVKLAEFEDGSPAVTIAEYGKGKAAAIGSYIGLPVHRENNLGNAKFIAGLVDTYGNIEKTKVDGVNRIRVDTLYDTNQNLMLIIQNKESEPVKTKIEMKINIERNLKEQFGKGNLSLNKTDTGCEFEVELKAKEVKVFCG